MAHTPGPWTIPEPWSGFSKIVGPNGELIFGLAAGAADEKRDDDECEANARLIAAAPDLLFALKLFVADHEGFSDEELRRRGRLLMRTSEAEALIVARMAIELAEMP